MKFITTTIAAAVFAVSGSAFADYKNYTNTYVSLADIFHSEDTCLLLQRTEGFEYKGGKKSEFSKSDKVTAINFNTGNRVIVNMVTDDVNINPISDASLDADDTISYSTPFTDYVSLFNDGLGTVSKYYHYTTPDNVYVWGVQSMEAATTPCSELGV